MKYTYEKFIDEKIALIAKEPIVLDVGGGARFTKWLAKYKNLFADCDYRTMDYDHSTGADVVGDIHKIPLADNSIHAVICSSVLEHVANPAVAVQEIKRILKPGGKLFIYVPSIYPYHARAGHYPDYWRFFDDSLLLLCKDFSSVELCKFGGYFKAMSFFVPMQHKIQWLLRPLARALDHVFRTEKKHTTAGYYVYAIK
ncbi:MAG: class I SAM-dependent methyltransferase [Candidatus Pacebacteria bacterium]|jgi:ubiquinone/menaquinone biosynthesis C-methylase UbiE|nr:class I SAM-dependent methyltransferase [Candidatus Paceibacterota bacterium]